MKKELSAEQKEAIKENLILLKTVRTINNKIICAFELLITIYEVEKTIKNLIDVFYTEDEGDGEMTIYIGDEYMVFSKDGKDVKRGRVSSIWDFDALYDTKD